MYTAPGTSVPKYAAFSERGQSRAGTPRRTREFTSRSKYAAFSERGESPAGTAWRHEGETPSPRSEPATGRCRGRDAAAGPRLVRRHYVRCFDVRCRRHRIQPSTAPATATRMAAASTQAPAPRHTEAGGVNAAWALAAPCAQPWPRVASRISLSLRVWLPALSRGIAPSLCS